MKLPAFLTAVLSLFLLASACGGGDDSAKDLSTPPVRKAAVLPTIQISTAVPTAIPDAFNGDSLLMNVGALGNALQNCATRPGVSREDTLACVGKEMAAAKINPAALDFFKETGYWLVGFTEAGRIDMANVLPTELGGTPKIGILGPGRQLQVVSDLFAEKYPAAATDHAAPFRSDAKYQALADAARAKPGLGGAVDLRHYDDAQIETALQMASTPRFIIQIGIANACKSCGTGVAARYSFTFDLRGNLTETSFLGLCQGRYVSRSIAGGRYMLHEFASQYGGTASGTFNEPYLLDVAGLAECPQHLDF